MTLMMALLGVELRLLD